MAITGKIKSVEIHLPPDPDSSNQATMVITLDRLLEHPDVAAQSRKTPARESEEG